MDYYGGDEYGGVEYGGVEYGGVEYGGDEYGGVYGGDAFDDFTASIKRSFESRWFIGVLVYLFIVGLTITVLGFKTYTDDDGELAWGCIVPGIVSMFIPLSLCIFSWGK
jgi:hypothetical protein